MRASILRSIETVLKRTSSLSQSPSPSPFPSPSLSLSHLLRRSFASESSHRQPLASLMKLNPLDSKFSLYDIAGTPGVTADVSHINTRSEAVIKMISNPVNSTVPIATEVFKKAGTYDEKKLFGVTTLDFVRARTFYAGKAGVNVADVDVPVVGGHAGITILPLFSQATPRESNLSDEEITAFTKRIQDGGTDVVEAKAGKGFATLSMAYAGAVFANACLNGLNGVPDIVECSYMQSTITGLPFFASKVRLGKNGVEEVAFFSLLYRPAAFILLLNSLFFKRRNEGIGEIMADYVHQEMTRNLFLIYLRLFLLIVITDVFLLFVF